MPSRLSLFALLLCAAIASQAGTYIEGRDDTGSQRILIEGDWARMEYGEDVPPEYLLLNLRTHQALNVDRVQKRVVDLSEASNQAAAPRASAANIAFKKQGAGPTIAGYATDRYVLSAGKQICGEHYVAAQALDIPDIRRFVAAMSAFSQNQEAAREACAAAESVADQEYVKHGLPLKVTDRRGNIEHEIRRISSGVSFPAGTFDLPANYPVTTPRALMEELKRAAEERNKQTPEPTDAATIKKLREQQMQEHMKEMQRLPPPPAR